MNLKLYKQFSDAYQQCIRSAFEDSAIRGKLERWLGVSRPRESQFYLSRRGGTAPSFR